LIRQLHKIISHQHQYRPALYADVGVGGGNQRFIASGVRWVGIVAFDAMI
jgi:hypothetical protein